MLAEYVTNSRMGIGNVLMETITTLSTNQLQTSLRADTAINSFRNNYL